MTPLAAPVMVKMKGGSDTYTAMFGAEDNQHFQLIRTMSNGAQVTVVVIKDIYYKFDVSMYYETRLGYTTLSVTCENGLK